MSSIRSREDRFASICTSLSRIVVQLDDETNSWYCQCPGGTFDEPGGLFDSIGKGPLEWSSNGTSLWSLFEEDLDSAPFVNNKAAIEMLE